MPRRSASLGPNRNLVLVLGDQLSPAISSLAAADRTRDVILMCEVMAEATYVKHHKKKIALIFSAMRHFANELREQGWNVHYVKIDDDVNKGSFAGEVERAIASFVPARVIVTEPGEWRVLDDMSTWSSRFGVPVEILSDTRFIASTAEFAAWARDRKQLRMEYFYRDIRRKTGLLIENGEPVGGKWNFDRDNRKPATADLFMPQSLQITPDAITLLVIKCVNARFADHFGDLEPFGFAVTSTDAERVFAHFLDTGLTKFGDYQDAMLTGERFLYHSVISMYLNCGLLDALTMCRAVEAAFKSGRAPLNAAEGYIRQIIGWREYVRGIYWLKMPEYAASNKLEHMRPLPDFYWTAETKMTCVAAAVTQTREDAYAHHIQRLMITGNFALLAGISPQALHEWYLIVYADAYEWVELPNTIGMSQFADGGLLASKPYAASGAYINRMSDYCGHCAYDVKSRTGPNACPFNALYWDFIRRNAATFKRNPRMGTIVRAYEKFTESERERIASSASAFLDTLKPSPNWP